MKTRITIAILAALLTAGTALKAQDYPQEYLGLPGDNLNLYAVMKLFQDSRTLEAFERNLNNPKNRINNLDLNGDNLVDYITVNDNVDGDIHYIVLRVPVNRRESQDVAVFTVEKLYNGEIYVQLIGDELLYGKNYIIEPTPPVMLTDWPLVRYVYRPNYIVWHSTWYWDFYPPYWNPWRPSYWHYYYGYHYNWHNDYYNHYRFCNAHHDIHWNDHYYIGHRVYSPVVTVNINRGHYTTTYSHPEQKREGEEIGRRHIAEQGRRTTYSSYTGSTANRQSNTTNTISRRTSEGSTNGTVREERTIQSSNGERRTSPSAVREERTVQNTNGERRISSSTVREERPVQSSTYERRTTQAAVSEERPVQSTTREQRTIQSAVREERPVQYNNSATRITQSAVREERPVQNSGFERRTIQSEVREERPIQNSTVERRTIQSAVREERPVQSSGVERRIVQSEVREERPVQTNTREVRAVQSTAREERTAPVAHKSQVEERQVKNTSETDKKIEPAGASRRR